MDKNSPVYTRKTECHDCYKCVRHCVPKSIRVSDGSASIISDACIACGVCVNICPAGAKSIRDDTVKVRELLRGNDPVYVSLAPSWKAHFGAKAGQKLITALIKLGFTGISETALGAQQVSSMTGRILHEADNGIYISSACPVAVEFIEKYVNNPNCRVMDLLSPAQVHARMLHRFYGDNIKVVFLGPCIGKKKESARTPELLDAALTFTEFENWLKEAGLDMKKMPESAGGFVPEPAEEGNLYPIEGGMISTIMEQATAKDIIYLPLAGLNNLASVLGSAKPEPDRKIFIEALACDNGCINGPGCSKDNQLIHLADIAALRSENYRSSLERKIEVSGKTTQQMPPAINKPVDDDKLTAVLRNIGKYSRNDELNCGSCGYSTCRQCAAAILEKKAEPAMCVSYLRKLAQKKANALIKYIPAGVVVFDRKLKIVEANRNFSKLFGPEVEKIFDASDCLAGANLKKIVPFHNLFNTVLETGSDLQRQNYVCDDRIFDIYIFNIEPHRVVGAIIKDITSLEISREQVAEHARKIILKNIMTVQTIANCLGEHMADTEILLREVSRKYQGQPNIRQHGESA